MLRMDPLPMVGAVVVQKDDSSVVSAEVLEEQPVVAAVDRKDSSVGKAVVEELEVAHQMGSSYHSDSTDVVIAHKDWEP